MEINKMKRNLLLGVVLLIVVTVFIWVYKKDSDATMPNVSVPISNEIKKFETVIKKDDLDLSLSGNNSSSILNEFKTSEKISNSGGSIQLTDVAKVDFPSGSLDGTEVTVSKVESTDFSKDFDDTAGLFGATGQNKYQVTIDVKGTQPMKATNVTLTIPGSLTALAPSGSELRAFYTLYQISDDEREKTVEALSDRFAVDAKTITISLPPEAFSSEASNGHSVYQAIIYLGFTPTARN
ncbi:hypothetical protein HY061_01320 [Candidatus Azambacteria bacterium]|nr:hypothetical protein [Candidatus Azambacteria bacterium]